MTAGHEPSVATLPGVELRATGGVRPAALAGGLPPLPALAGGLSLLPALAMVEP